MGAHGREPTVWLDSLCIDQADIAAQLPSLPVYLAGCKSVLALAGPTYFQRLWCVLELHIFHQMGGSLDHIVLVPLDGTNVSAGEARPLSIGKPAFDVHRASATDPHDQERLLAVIEGSGEGIAAFNEWVRTALMPLAALPRSAQPPA